ncbi:MFS transporter small subunit [Streptomyces abyssalis]|uniref:MFS transporter small subunit n=1 Tax=Streptomyces abyssalis TaxID=933944 RepID=UPI000A5B2591|nr:hypothetical protein [Streptomyces abyssalis]
MTTGENSTPGAAAQAAAPGGPPTALFALAWLWVGVPMAYGIYELVLKVTKLFTGG